MTTYFPEIKNKIQYEGKASGNPLAFKYYDTNGLVNGKSMSEHLRFAVAYWHTFQGTGADMFGGGAFERSWKKETDPMTCAMNTMDAAFEFFEKLNVSYYCFHDRDIAPEGKNFAESCRNLEVLVQNAKEKQQETGVKLLWGTANLFSHPRYTNGAATNPDAHVFAHAAAQVKNAIDATYELGGENYVFWGGREGYETLLNTNLKQERENLANFLHMAVDYAKKIGFKGQFLIEPKPKEPTKHQYDFDSATVLGFLREFDLIDDFKLNVEANHATLAGHDFEHDLAVASLAGKLGSMDVNRGDMLLGWDTDQFPTNIYDAVKSMLVILKQDGIAPGGLNFDAKLRRPSSAPEDLFYAHIGGMDTYAKALLIAQKMIDDGVFDQFVSERYGSYQSGIGQKISNKQSHFEELERYILEKGEPTMRSGRQEMLENIFNSYL
jgi:xylose isomerase